MDDNVFTTETDAEYVKSGYKKACLISFMLFSLFACLGFLVAWQTFVFFEVFVIFSTFVTFFKLRNNNNHWKLKFKGDELTIINLTNHEVFTVYDIPASDFIINQTKSEKRLDYCSLAIKHTVFTFGGVKNCKKLKEYIKDNYE